jgi:Zn-dependent membrane protease YugP
MTGLKRVRPLALITPVVLLLALALPAVGVAATSSSYTKESQQAYEKQLDGGEIAEGTVNKRLGNLRIKTKNGDLFLYHYQKKGEPAVVAALEAHHVKVTVLAPAEAAKEVHPKVKHKLRYIAGGVVIVVILIVGGVLLFRRRGREDE